MNTITNVLNEEYCEKCGMKLGNPIHYIDGVKLCGFCIAKLERLKDKIDNKEE